MALLKIVFSIVLILFAFPVWAQSQNITMVFGGDVTLGGHYPRIAPNAFTDFGWPFRKLKPIFNQADLVMVNCENAITTHDKKLPKTFNFKMDPRLVQVFKENNISLVTLANNHVVDYGIQGLRDTMMYLREGGIDFVGAGENLELARTPVKKYIKGKKIYFFGYGNYFPATNKSPGVAYRHEKDILEDIKKAKADGADYIVINLHWGVEGRSQPEQKDKNFAHQAIDQGADIIIGHHPHVTQPVEVYKGKVIAYSLGNFVFGGNSRGPKQSIIVKIDIAPGGQISHEVIKVRICPQETKYQPYIVK